MTAGTFERKVKRFVYGSPHTAVFLPGPGFPETVSLELGALLSDPVTVPRFSPRAGAKDRSVSVEEIDYRLLCELALRTLTAADARLLLASGRAERKEELAGVLERTPFELYLPPGASCTVRADSGKSRLYHEGLVEDAAAAALARKGFSPAGEGSFAVHLTLFENRLSVEISMAGEPLWKRGYRGNLSASAPLREDLAQSALRRALDFHADGGARPRVDTLLIPFSGTGTFLFESLMDRWNVPARAFGREYAFERFACAHPENTRWVSKKLAERTSDLLSKEADGRGVRAVLVDTDSDALSFSEAGAGVFFAGIDGWVSSRESDGAGADGSLQAPLYRPEVSFLNRDAFQTPWTDFLPDGPGTVLLPLNPPYGRRLRGKNRDYRILGERVAGLAETLDAGSLFGLVLCPDEDLWKDFLSCCGGLRTSTMHFSQGGLDIRLLLFSSRRGAP